MRRPREGDDHLAIMTRHQDESTTQRIKVLDAKIDAINTEANALVTVNTLIRQTKPLFIE